MQGKDTSRDGTGTAFGKALVLPADGAPHSFHLCCLPWHSPLPLPETGRGSAPPQNACQIPQKDKGILPICQSPVSHPQLELEQEHVAITCRQHRGGRGYQLWAGAQLRHHGDQEGTFRDLQPPPMAEWPGPKSCWQPCDWQEGKNPVASGPHYHTSFQLLWPGNKQLFSQ